MRTEVTGFKPRDRTSVPGIARVLAPVGRFAVHLAEMCVVMCLGAVLLSVVFFGAAGLLGYDDLTQTAPELSVFVIALNLSVPMVVWMRYWKMDWQHTLEMSGATMAVGLFLIAGSWLGWFAPDHLVEVQTSLACPVMLAAMLVRFPFYASKHDAHQADRAPG